MGKVYEDQISGYYFDKLEELKEMASLDEINPWEAAFLDDRWQAMEEFGRYMRLSDKQKYVLKEICYKVGV